MEDWYFTFGYGQTLRAFTPGGAVDVIGQGVPLDNAYVKIRAPHGHAARTRMVELFGRVWCDQYANLPDVPGLEWRDLSALIPDATPASNPADSPPYPIIDPEDGLGSWTGANLTDSP